MVSIKIVALTLLSAIGVHAAVHEVKVGAGGLVFDPPQLTGVAAGDDVSFIFQAKNHTVTQSTFAEPCKAKPAGVNSGFMLVPPEAPEAKPTWTITIDNPAEPLWFYCRQKTPADHCAAGMVFSLNPTAEKSHEAFVEKAKAAAPAGGASAAPGAATPAASAAPGTDAQPQAALSSNGAGALSTSSMAGALAVMGVISAIL